MNGLTQVNYDNAVAKINAAIAATSKLYLDAPNRHDDLLEQARSTQKAVLTLLRTYERETVPNPAVEKLNAIQDVLNGA